ncbi:MAG: hypothetical protein ACI31D_06510 [Candidatus Limisoma sp.]
MKKTILFTLAAVVVTAFVSCGNKTESSAAADSVATDSCQTEAVATVDDKTLTVEGFGIIKIGKAMTSLDASVEGVYDGIEEDPEGEFWSYYVNQDGSTICCLDVDENNAISRIGVMYVEGGANDIKTVEGIYPGMPEADLKKVEGVEKAGADDFGRASYKTKGGVTLVIDAYVDKGNIVSEMQVEK